MKMSLIQGRFEAMEPGTKHLFTMVVSFFSVLSLLTTGCSNKVPTPGSQPAQNQTQVFAANSAPQSSIKVDLSLGSSPELGQPVPVTATFALQWDERAANVTACIILLGGFELVSGKLEWQGDMLRGTRYEIKATIRATKLGEGKIQARAFYSPGKNIGRGGSVYLYTSVYEDGAIVSDRPLGPGGMLYGSSTGYPSLIIRPARLKVPLLGEPLKLEVTIKSIEDLAEAEAFVEFYRAGVRVPLKDILVEGQLTWQGSLRKDVAVQFSGSVKLPEEGDWQITGYTSSLMGSSTLRKEVVGYTSPLTGRTALHQHDMFLHLGKEKSWFYTPPARPTTPVPPPPPSSHVPLSGPAKLSNPLTITGGFLYIRAVKEI